MQYNRNNNSNFSGSGGVARTCFFASSVGDIPIPINTNIGVAEKFSNGVHTIILFRTRYPVTWNDAMAMFPRPTAGAGHGQVMVTICKGPIGDLDEPMFNLMLKALLASNKWTHADVPQQPYVNPLSVAQPTYTHFETDALGNTQVAPSPSPVPVPVPIHLAMATKRARSEPAVAESPL